MHITTLKYSYKTCRCCRCLHHRVFCSGFVRSIAIFILESSPIGWLLFIFSRQDYHVIKWVYNMFCQSVHQLQSSNFPILPFSFDWCIAPLNSVVKNHAGCDEYDCYLRLAYTWTSVRQMASLDMREPWIMTKRNSSDDGEQTTVALSPRATEPLYWAQSVYQHS